jgi:uncharacterized protein YchJ
VEKFGIFKYNPTQMYSRRNGRGSDRDRRWVHNYMQGAREADDAKKNSDLRNDESKATPEEGTDYVNFLWPLSKEDNESRTLATMGYYQEKTTWYYLDKENNLESFSKELDEKTIKEKQLKSLEDIIKSKKLQDDFIAAYKKSPHFVGLVKQANFYKGTMEPSNVTSTASILNEKNEYEGSRIRIIPGKNISSNVVKMTWELTNMKNHAAIDELSEKTRSGEIKKVDDYILATVKIEAEAAFNQKIVLKDAGGLYTYKGLEKYDTMSVEELEKNKAQFIADYMKQDFKAIKIEGQSISVWDKYAEQYYFLVREEQQKKTEK